jgi:hypothetical protein
MSFIGFILLSLLNGAVIFGATFAFLHLRGEMRDAKRRNKK